MTDAQKEVTTISIRVATLIAFLVVVIQGAFWAGSLSQRVLALETGNATATEDRWTKTEAVSSHKIFENELKHVHKAMYEIQLDVKQILERLNGTNTTN